jgi:hypothetical protein
MAAMRRWLASCLCACAYACFHETDIGGSSDGPAADSSTSATTITSATSASEVTTVASTSTISDTTAVTASDDTSPDETTAGDCGNGVAVPPHEGWMGPIAIGLTLGKPTSPCPGGMESVAWGLAGGASPMCSCRCQGGPSVLCNVSMTYGMFSCDTTVPMNEDCNDIGSAAHLQVTVDAAACNPDVASPEVLDNVPTVFACALPQPMQECVVVPEGLQGPCVIGGAGECPEGYSPHEAIAAVQGCSPCILGCSTADYCGGVVVTPYSASSCPLGSALTPIDAGPSCITNFAAEVASVGLMGAGEPVCPDVAASVLPSNVCCVI